MVSKRVVESSSANKENSEKAVTKRKSSKSEKTTSAKTTSAKKTTAKKTNPKKTNPKKTNPKKTNPKKASSKKASSKKHDSKQLDSEAHFLKRREIREQKKTCWKQLFTDRDRAHRVLDKHRALIKSHPCVTGVHLGYKRITVHDEGELSQRLAKPLTYAICVHVKAKLPPNHPECEWAIPKYFNGVPTDIVANQFISTKFASSTIDSQTQRVKEIQGGIAIGLKGDSTSFGTLGFVVKFFGESAYLTNNHVAGKAGNKVIQPPSTGKVIGSTLRSKKTLKVDGAIISPEGNIPYSQTFMGLNVASKFIRDGELNDDDIGEDVLIIGAKTDITKGQVESVSGEVTVTDQGEFINQIIVKSSDGKPITGGGNSGGLLVKKEKIEDDTFYNIVGLVHASSVDSTNVIASHFSDVKKVLGIRLR